ncbi:hypothetical protein DPMN_180003 [Dreissena polymorpha]|uniref:Uncharacterized protein n=1 Tax=Dreissena polymorpha TaxID=45954 RepID=A0A9D4EF55_DREPO|nr:hypothetical protein DPMN_180003 [Dreissena polymorpha]
MSRPTRLVMGPCIVEIDQVNRCRNEVIIVKGNFGWAWPMWAGRPRVGNGAMHTVQYQFEVNRCRNKEIIRGAPGLVMGPCIVEINRIVIREVQYQFEVNLCRNEKVIVKGNFGWAWPMWPGRLRIDHIVIREVQYQFEVNQCRNEEIIVKGNFGWAWPMWAGHQRVGNGAMHKVQYQFEDNRCRNEEIIFQGSMARTDGGDNHNIPTLFKKRGDIGNFGWVWLIMGKAPQVEIDRIVIRDVQYQFEVNRCRNEEIIVKGNFGWAVGNVTMHKVQYQFEVNRCRNEETIAKGNFGWGWPM